MSKRKVAKIKRYCHAKRAGAIGLEIEDFPRSKSIQKDTPELSAMCLKPGSRPGVFFGRAPNTNDCIGMPEGADGNLVIIGGNGSGKSRGIAMPTLATWHSAIVATDIKGELSAKYAQFWRSGKVTRPFIVFDPTRADGPSYDPFWWLMKDDDVNIISNIWDIVRALIPLSPEDRQPFWVETEQALFAAALLHGFLHGLSFSETVCFILSQPARSLAARLAQHGDLRVHMLLGEIADMKEETIACVDRGLRNKLMLLATDAQISHALRGKREAAHCFSWDDLKKNQVFLRIPAHKIEQWAGVIQLMYAQLFRYLEHRPEYHTPAAAEHPRLLLLMDEFARFGRLDGITPALSTLRSKKVNICLFLQSIAQIDRFYGSEERKIMLDNCQWQVILRANDPDTQEYFSRQIGKSVYRQHSVGKQLDSDLKKTGFSMQISETRDWIVAPHELSTLHDVLLLTPNGFFQIDKDITIGTTEKQKPNKSLNNQSERNEEVSMKAIEKRTQHARQQLEESERRQRSAEHRTQQEQHKADSRRKYIIGELVLQYFPKLRQLELSQTKEQTRQSFLPFEQILAALADSPDMMQALRNRAKQHSGHEVYSDDV